MTPIEVPLQQMLLRASLLSALAQIQPLAAGGAAAPADCTLPTCCVCSASAAGLVAAQGRQASLEPQHLMQLRQSRSPQLSLWSQLNLALSLERQLFHRRPVPLPPTLMEQTLLCHQMPLLQMLEPRHPTLLHSRVQHCHQTACLVLRLQHMAVQTMQRQQAMLHLQHLTQASTADQLMRQTLLPLQLAMPIRMQRVQSRRFKPGSHPLQSCKTPLRSQLQRTLALSWQASNSRSQGTLRRSHQMQQPLLMAAPQVQQQPRLLQLPCQMQMGKSLRMRRLCMKHRRWRPHLVSKAQREGRMQSLQRTQTSGNIVALQQAATMHPSCRLKV